MKDLKEIEEVTAAADAYISILGSGGNDVAVANAFAVYSAAYRAAYRAAHNAFSSYNWGEIE